MNSDADTCCFPVCHGSGSRKDFGNLSSHCLFWKSVYVFSNKISDIYIVKAFDFPLIAVSWSCLESEIVIFSTFHGTLSLKLYCVINLSHLIINEIIASS
jgi:hypothetical protein